MVEFNGPKYNIDVVLSDGNAFAVMGAVTSALKDHLRGTFTSKEILEEVDAFRNEAMSGDYDELLQTCERWINVIV